VILLENANSARRRKLSGRCSSKGFHPFVMLPGQGRSEGARRSLAVPRAGAVVRSEKRVMAMASSRKPFV